VIDLKLNKKRFGSHWHYYWSRYIIFVGVALLVANLLFSVTKPQVPYNNRVDIIIVSNAFNSDLIDAWQQDILSMLPPDQVEVSIQATPIMQGQEATVQQAVTARMAANEGTIWILTADYFASFAAGGVFKPLDKDISLFRVPQGTNLDAGRANVQPDQNMPATKQLCGIPLDKATGLSDLFLPIGMVMAIPVFANVNYANAVTVANYLLSKTQEPTGVTQAPEAQQVNLIVATHAFVADKTADWRKSLEAALPAGQGANVSQLAFTTGRESYVADVIQSRLKQKAGGLCIIPQDVFVTMARKGYLLPLDSEVSSFSLPSGIDLSAGKEYAMKKDKSAGPVQLYGIPLDGFAGLSEFFNPKGMVLAFMAQPTTLSAENHAGAITAANWILGKLAAQ
jgi:hypothetical protein